MASCAGSGLACAESGGVIPGIRAGMIQFPELRSVFLLACEPGMRNLPAGPITKIICRDSDG